MSNRILVFALIVVALAAQSCIRTTAPTDSPDPLLGYYPLEIGNVWEYESMVPTFAEHHSITRVIEHRSLGAVQEYDLVDSIFNAMILTSTEHYSIRQSGNITFAADSSWLINFSATAADNNDRHGFVMSRADTSTVPAGLFHDIVRIYYPACAYDGRPNQDFAAGVGLIRNLPYGIPVHLRRAIIHGQKFGTW